MSDPRQPLVDVRNEVSKAVVGQDPTIWGLLAALLSGGHVLLEGVPGVAKTLVAKATAHALELDFARVQFTPDLMPSDVTGNVVYEAKTGEFRFRPGPVFTNILLADEINRTPPKTQSSLLEAMQERQVSVEGEAYELPDPFMVIATQNPIEYEGTYPLPEAQLDRFLLKLRVGYPDPQHERAILQMHHEGVDPHELASTGMQQVAGPRQLAKARAAAGATTVSDDILDYLGALTQETRRTPALLLGVSPRGATMLLSVAKSWAFLQGRDFVTPDDIKVMLKPAWRHRIILRPEAELEGGTADTALERVVERTPVPR